MVRFVLGWKNDPRRRKAGHSCQLQDRDSRSTNLLQRYNCLQRLVNFYYMRTTLGKTFADNNDNRRLQSPVTQVAYAQYLFASYDGGTIQEPFLWRTHFRRLCGNRSKKKQSAVFGRQCGKPAQNGINGSSLTIYWKSI